MANSVCVSCLWENETGRKIDTSRSKVAWAEKIGVSEASVRRHLKHAPVTPPAARAEPPEFGGDDFLTNYDIPVQAVTSRGMSIRDPETGSWEKVSWQPNKADGPAWPLVQPAAAVDVTVLEPDWRDTRDSRYLLAAKCADTQIGFRFLADGTVDPFHDPAAMDLFVDVCNIYQPDKITVLGDFLDFASFGRFAQEASFANTTQLSLDYAHQWLAKLRAACPDAEIIVIEGNHDKRMQNFVETNAVAAFGLRLADMPESWPVMSLPNLLRLADLDVHYVDAYPAATDWDNSRTRNIHGTRANSKGSTMSQYVHELPHVNTWAGHTHRAEVVYRTVLGEYGLPVESYAANPGVLCRTDGSVPSVHGSISANGDPARIVEDWQQGFGLCWYNESESIPQVYRIWNGRTVIDGRVIGV